MPSLTVLVTDLIFATKITSTAQSLGVDAKTVRNLDGLNERLSAVPDTVVWIDMDASGVDPIEAIRNAKSLEPTPFVLAYLSHVQADLAREAHEAGADEVLPRSAFSARLPDLLEAVRERTTSGA